MTCLYHILLQWFHPLHVLITVYYEYSGFPIYGILHCSMFQYSSAYVMMARSELNLPICNNEKINLGCDNCAECTGAYLRRGRDTLLDPTNAVLVRCVDHGLGLDVYKNCQYWVVWYRRTLTGIEILCNQVEVSLPHGIQEPIQPHGMSALLATYTESTTDTYGS